MKLKQNQNDLIISYIILRQLIGVIGIVLPLSLIVGNRLLGNEHWLQESISHYFYSYMHFAFVGVLCLLGGVLISYREIKSNLANCVSNCAGVFAFGVAIFPTEYNGFMGSPYLCTSVWHSWFKYIHFGSALLLFVCFTIFCFKIFQEHDDTYSTPAEIAKKERRNAIYKLCGWGIVVSILIMAGSFGYEWYFKTQTTFTKYSTFIFETTAMLFFGNSWLLKGSLYWKNSSYTVVRRAAALVR